MHRYLLVLLLSPFMVLLGCGGQAPKKDHVFTVGFMPKLVKIPYFNACKKGAEEAAQELGIKLVYDGPTKADVNQQIDMLNQWIASGEYDCICVACNDPDRIAPVLKRAQGKGITIITFDADTQPGARSFFVNQATYAEVAHAMVDVMAAELEPPGVGKVGILTSSVQAPNQAQWASRMRTHAQAKYPQLELLEETQHGEDRELGVTRARTLIQATEGLKGIIGLTSVAVPAAAEAVRQEGKKGQIKVTGVSTPRDMRDYVQDDTVKTFVLWNPIDLGYLTVHVAKMLDKGRVPPDGTLPTVGRLKDIVVRDQEILLGKPMRFTKGNVDQFDF